MILRNHDVASYLVAPSPVLRSVIPRPIRVLCTHRTKFQLLHSLGRKRCCALVHRSFVEISTVASPIFSEFPDRIGWFWKGIKTKKLDNSRNELQGGLVVI